MKKRIGSKLYDTEKSELILESVFGKLYRKKKRDREWFLVNDNIILPMTDKEARAMLGENEYIEKPPDPYTWLRVHRESRDKIAELAQKDGLSIIDEVKKIVSVL